MEVALPFVLNTLPNRIFSVGPSSSIVIRKKGPAGFELHLTKGGRSLGRPTLHTELDLWKTVADQVPEYLDDEFTTQSVFYKALAQRAHLFLTFGPEWVEEQAKELIECYKSYSSEIALELGLSGGVGNNNRKKSRNTAPHVFKTKGASQKKPFIFFYIYPDYLDPKGLDIHVRTPTTSVEESLVRREKILSVLDEFYRHHGLTKTCAFQSNLLDW